MKKIIPSLLCMLLIMAGSLYAETISRNETVYVNLDSGGKPISTEVVTWLRTDGGSSQDAVELDHIKNVKGLNKPVLGEGKVSFKSENRNLFYSGTTDKQLPVSVDISYRLDGREIAYNALKGKSGKLEINIDLKNETTVMRDIDYTEIGTGIEKSTREEVYTPFIVMVNMDLDINKFAHVDSPEGVFVVLGDTMKMNWITVPTPEANVNMTAYVEDLSMPSIMIEVIPKMVPLPEMEIEEKLNEIYEGVDKVGEYLDKLHDGAVEINDGHEKLVDAVEKVDDGTEKLVLASDAQKQMTEGAIKINDGIVDKIDALLFLPSFRKISHYLNIENELLTLTAEGGEFNDTVLDFLHDQGKDKPEVDEFPGISVTRDGIEKLHDGSGEMLEGVIKLRDGSTKLADSIAQVKEEGTEEIKKGISEGSEELVVTLAKIEVAKEMVEDYDRFAGLPSDVESSVQFIMKTPEM